MGYSGKGEQEADCESGGVGCTGGRGRSGSRWAGVEFDMETCRYGQEIWLGARRRVVGPLRVVDENVQVGNGGVGGDAAGRFGLGPAAVFVAVLGAFPRCFGSGGAFCGDGVRMATLAVGRILFLRASGAESRVMAAWSEMKGTAEQVSPAVEGRVEMVAYSAQFSGAVEAEGAVALPLAAPAPGYWGLRNAEVEVPEGSMRLRAGLGREKNWWCSAGVFEWQGLCRGFRKVQRSGRGWWWRLDWSVGGLCAEGMCLRVRILRRERFLRRGCGEHEGGAGDAGGVVWDAVSGGGEVFDLGGEGGGRSGGDGVRE